MRSWPPKKDPEDHAKPLRGLSWDRAFEPLQSDWGCPQRSILMPKMKTNRGAAKRLRKTGTGKIRRMRAYKSHILTKKSRKRKRRLRSATLVAKSDEKQVRRLLAS